MKIIVQRKYTRPIPSLTNTALLPQLNVTLSECQCFIACWTDSSFAAVKVLQTADRWDLWYSCQHPVLFTFLAAAFRSWLAGCQMPGRCPSVAFCQMPLNPIGCDIACHIHWSLSTHQFFLAKGHNWCTCQNPCQCLHLCRHILIDVFAPETKQHQLSTNPPPFSQGTATVVGDVYLTA